MRGPDVRDMTHAEYRYARALCAAALVGQATLAFGRPGAWRAADFVCAYEQLHGIRPTFAEQHGLDLRSTAA